MRYFFAFSNALIALTAVSPSFRASSTSAWRSRPKRFTSSGEVSVFRSASIDGRI